MSNNEGIFKNTSFDFSKTIHCLLFLVIFGTIQSTLFLNLSFLIVEPKLFPATYLSTLNLDTISMLVASLFLIFKSSDFYSKQWWRSFLAMYIGFALTKFFGVYVDTATYQIARFRNEQIGGGAAFGHLFFLLYLLGSAQAVSMIVWMKNKN